MALGIVSDDIFENEINKFLGEIVQHKKLGRTEGAHDVPDNLRKAIGDTVLESGKQAGLELASAFDISPSQVKAYARGQSSSYSSPTPTLGAHIARTKERIARRAGKLTVRALDNITDEKLAIASASELASVARSAAVIVREMEPPVSMNQSVTPTVQFVIHAPPMAREEKYEVIDVTSNDRE